MSQFREDNRQRQLKPGVESWFFRGVAPDSPTAIWVKFTTLLRADGNHVAEVWCSVFEAENCVGAKETFALQRATLAPNGQELKVGRSSAEFGNAGGSLRGEVAQGITLAWDLRFEVVQDLGQPLCMLPTRRLVDAPIPRNKLLTPGPVLRFSGNIRVGERQIEVQNWLGSQGHNWGAAHAAKYAWGQAIFTDSAGEPHTYVEGASGEIKIGSWQSPQLSMLVVRRLNLGRLEEYRFDRLVDLWRQDGRIDFPTWTLKMRGAQGHALLTLEAMPERMVCLGYYNPDGSLAYCLNSKTARARLVVNPRGADGFECSSEHVGALEFLQPSPEPRVQPVI